ncbi:MAG TPA: hypothetical protein VK970_19175 [Candidatus Methylacidiphilales bacterium]|nr:hypothetical protein [Candidatus Methylacidiphilales bacterium]
MPEAGPFVKRAPRTGEPAVYADKRELGPDDEFIDHASKRKRQERGLLKGELPPIATAFGFTDSEQLPDDFEEVSGGDGSYLAVIHADGNQLGKMFLEVGQALALLAPENIPSDVSIELIRFLSRDVVTQGTQAAVGTAMKKALPKEVLNRRPLLFAPIVLAGDDVTVVCRADLGLSFTEEFLKAFRTEMTSRLTDLRAKSWWSKVPDSVQRVIPDQLSAGAGLVYCTDHYPFSLAYGLCESLAKYAKAHAKDSAKSDGKQTPDSAVSFARIVGASAPTEYDELKRSLLKGSDDTLLTGGPYFVEMQSTPHLDSLKKVREAALHLPGGALRGILNLQRTKYSAVNVAVDRMKEIAGDIAERNENWVSFEEAWKNLCNRREKDSNWQDLRFCAPDHKQKRSPLLDVLTLLAVRDKNDDRAILARGHQV